MKAPPAVIGKHLLADLSGISAELLRDSAALEALLRAAAHAAGATVLGSHFHHFGAGGGVTGVVLLAESHMSLHTWPESGFVAADIFMCGHADPMIAIELLLVALEPEHRQVRIVVRAAGTAVTEPPASGFVI
jgi:S-adenosylmethionine decarboxylase